MVLQTNVSPINSIKKKIEPKSLTVGRTNVTSLGFFLLLGPCCSASVRECKAAQIALWMGCKFNLLHNCQESTAKCSISEPQVHPRAVTPQPTFQWSLQVTCVHIKVWETALLTTSKRSLPCCSLLNRRKERPNFPPGSEPLKHSWCLHKQSCTSYRQLNFGMPL